ncbi:MAG: hypothetical protein JWN91_1782 [Nocardioides sp.]|nr:hypothetical protein [Nocardioides sp.]
MLSVVAGVIDLVDDRESEVGTGDVRLPLGVELGDSPPTRYAPVRSPGTNEP